MRETGIEERELHPKSGAAMLAVLVLLTLVSVAIIVAGGLFLDDGNYIAGGILLIVGIIALCAFSMAFAGLKVVRPNEARVLTLFGKYHGTIKTSGFYYVNPFCVSFCPRSGQSSSGMFGGLTVKPAIGEKNTDTNAIVMSAPKCVSLKTQTLNNNKQKVNDVLGNPIIIGAVVIWHVADPTKAVFAVENYMEFLSIQADSTVRNIARLYPYDSFDEDSDSKPEHQEKTLRGGAIEIADSMRDELQKRVESAGLQIEEVRITHLAYSEEIAAAMLQRQQAAAIIAARQKIVDGAVGMVKMAIDKLSEDEIVVLDEERKAAMVSNLLVVLCGNKDAQPVLNSGSIY